MDLVEEKGSPMAGAEFPATMMKVAVRNLQGQQIKRVTLGEEGLTSEVEVMVEAEELPTNVTSATNGGTDRLNVLKVIKQDKGEHMLFSPRKPRPHLKKWRTCLKQAKPWCLIKSC